jgi:uncharacterized protein with PIN domain
MSDTNGSLLLAAERTLGRLAKWLRILGHDVLWEPQLAGRTLIACARRDGRTVLTRDRRLALGPEPPRRVHVGSDDFRTQLQAVARELPIGAGPLFSRCTRCNRGLVQADAGEVSARVPLYVRETQQTFQTCTGCHRIYWPATHHARMREELATLGILA